MFLFKGCLLPGRGGGGGREAGKGGSVYVCVCVCVCGGGGCGWGVAAVAVAGIANAFFLGLTFFKQDSLYRKADRKSNKHRKSYCYLVECVERYTRCISSP